MPVRVKAILIIVSTTLVIIAFSIFAGVTFVQSNIEGSQEMDLIVLSDIADRFISLEIELLKNKAAEAAYKLSLHERALWQDATDSIEAIYPQFIGAAVIDSDRVLHAASGSYPAEPVVAGDRYVRGAYQGRVMISSTTPTSDGVVFYLAAPLPGMRDTALILTLPGTHFSQAVESVTIWETGHIFMDDAEGCLISNTRPLWVIDRIDFIDQAGIDSSNEKMIKDIRQGLVSEARIVRYSIYDIPRLCAYRPISGSEEGWLLGVVAPLTESPFRHTNRGLIVVGLVSMFLGLIAAVIASGFISRQYGKMIEDMRRAEIAEERNRAKDRFLAVMSHELRTPMNSIMGFSELALDLGDEQVPSKIKGYFSKILDSVKLLLAIVNDILDTTEIESGSIRLDYAPFDLEEVYEQCRAAILPGITEKGLKLEFDAHSPVGKKPIGDRERLAQVLRNLLTNAVKFSNDGTVRFVTEVKRMESSKATVYFEVSDNGIGISRKQLEHVFEPFYQADSDRTRKYGGIGLGLSITKKILEQMGGQLAVESQPNVGSKFSFELTFPTIDAPAGNSFIPD